MNCSDPGKWQLETKLGINTEVLTPKWCVHISKGILGLEYSHVVKACEWFSQSEGLDAIRHTVGCFHELPGLFSADFIWRGDAFRHDAIR